MLCWCCSHGPSLMPGGPREAYDLVKDVLELTAGEWWSHTSGSTSAWEHPVSAARLVYWPGNVRSRVPSVCTRMVAAKTDSGPCVTYIGDLGSGNYVKMIHNGIEYGDMQVRAGGGGRQHERHGRESPPSTGHGHHTLCTSPWRCVVSGIWWCLQLIAEAYDILKTVGGLTNEELAATFAEWNAGEWWS